MKMTSFLAGAVVGAAAITYMNRNKTMMVSFSQMGDNLSKVVDKAMMSFAEKNMSTRREQDTSLDKVEELASRDPQVQSEVNEILNQNHVSVQ